MTKKEVTTDPTPQSGQRKVSIIFTGCQKEPWFFGKRLIARCQSLNCELIHLYCRPLIHNSSFDTRFHYASDNPLASGQTLAAGEMGEEGIRPTYMVTKVILEKLFTKA